MRKLLFLLLLFGVNLSCQTGRKAAKKHVVIDLPDNKKHGFWEYETEKPMKFKALSLGDFHACGILQNGSATCWGRNGFGEANAPEGKSFRSLALLERGHSCGISTDGKVICWGSLGYLSCPIGHPPSGPCDWVTLENPEGKYKNEKFKSLAASQYHYCGIKVNGNVVCWGDDDGRATAPLGTFETIALGNRHSCGLLADGRIKCWGGGIFANSAESPAKIIKKLEVPQGQFKSLKGGGSYSSHFCGIRTNGNAECWVFGGRYNPYGAVGIPGKFKALELGGDNKTCGILEENDRVKCWQFPLCSGGGYESPYRCKSDRYRVIDIPSDLGPVRAIAAGRTHFCAIRKDDSVKCWFGHGNLRSKNDIAAQSGQFKHLVGGHYMTCGILEDGSAKCWGSNEYGPASVPGAIKGRAARICMGSSKNTCDFTDGCIWDPEPSAANAGHCLSKNWIACSWVKSAEACMQVGCNWAGTTCTPKPRSECYLQREKAQCMKLPGCQFDGKRCMDKAREL